MRHFGSLKRIEEATLEDLLKVPSVNAKIAQEILQALRPLPIEGLA
ncbi:MAG: helix-hairpin-helix domain-containing protein [Candidatus Binatota bacterium]